MPISPPGAALAGVLAGAFAAVMPPAGAALPAIVPPALVLPAATLPVPLLPPAVPPGSLTVAREG